MEKCPVCGLKHIETEGIDYKNFTEVDCVRCGKYQIRTDLSECLKLTDAEVAKISGYLRENSNIENYIKFSFEESEGITSIESLKLLPEKTLAEKGKLLLEFLYKKNSIPGHVFKFSDKKEILDLIVTSFLFNEHSLNYLINDYLVNHLYYLKGYSGGNPETRTLGDKKPLFGDLTQPTFGDFVEIAITPSGHTIIESIGVQRDTEKVFIAMAFNFPELEPLKNTIKEAIRECGYAPNIIIDKKDSNEKICDQIIVEIKRSKFLIADLTQQKPNVYYEAGFAKGLGLPVFFSCRENEVDISQESAVKVGFDIRQYPITLWKNQDVEELKKYKSDLVSRIQATIGQGPLMLVDSNRSV